MDYEKIFWEIVKMSGNNCDKINKIRKILRKKDNKLKKEIDKIFNNYYSLIYAKMEPLIGDTYDEDDSGFKDFVFYLLSGGKNKIDKFLNKDYSKNYFKDFSKFNVEYKIKKKLYEKKSEYQMIQVFKTDEFGNMLVIDNDVQLTEADEANYHEMIAHVPLAYFDYDVKVLIVGGGDGGTAREVLKHKNVVKCDMIDIDKFVIEAATLHFPEFSKVFNHPTKYNGRFNLMIGDGYKYAMDYDPYKDGFYDLVIIDSTDFNQSIPLFTEKFYERLKLITKKESLICFNADNINWNDKNIINMVKFQKTMFNFVNPFTVYIPTFAGGFYSFCLVSNSINPINFLINWEYVENKVNDMNLVYYSKNMHISSFTLPNKLSKKLNKIKSINKKSSIGHHFLLDIYDSSFKFLENLEQIDKIFTDAINIGKMNLLDKKFNNFKPYGITGFYLLAESHLSFHTWPEKGIITIDLFTCGNYSDSVKAIKYIKNNFKTIDYKFKYLNR